MASLAWGGVLRFGRGCGLDQEHRLSRPKPGRDASGGACAASGLGSEGEGRTLAGCVLLVVPARIPRHVVALRNQTGLVVASRIVPAVVANARLDTTSPARLASPADATVSP